MMQENDERDVKDRIWEATEWYLRLQADELPNDQLQQLEMWYAAPKNREAMEAVRRVSPEQGYIRCPELPTPEQALSDSYDGSVSVEEWRAQRKTAVEAGIRRKTLWRQRVLSAFAAAAALSGLAFTIRAFLGSYPTESQTTFTTPVGEHRDVVLSDGSKITMGARTVLTVHYTPDRRVIRLQDGQAFFNVAHNRARPFAVVAGGGIITAVGTRFDVRSDLSRVTVTVTEGTVEVAPNGGDSPIVQRKVRGNSWAPTRLVQGQQVTYGGNQQTTAVKDADAATEWVYGRLQYRQVPLTYVAADVERYFEKQIALGDPAAGECIFTGTIDQSQVEDWLRALEKIFPVDVSETDSTHIVIRSRGNAVPNCGAGAR